MKQFLLATALAGVGLTAAGAPTPRLVDIEPAPGYVTEFSNIIRLSFDNVKEIKYVKGTPDKEQMGVIRFDTPDTYYLSDVIIDGNQVIIASMPDNREVKVAGDQIFTPVDEIPVETYTLSGFYRLSLFSDNLVLVDLDGVEHNIGDRSFQWMKPNIPFPECEPAQGIVYELKTFTLTMPGDETLAMWMATPSLFHVNPDGTVGERICTTTRTPGPLRGEKSVTWTLNEFEYKPGEYVFKVGKATFSIQGASHTVSDDIWNTCEYLYYFTIPEPDPTRPVTTLGPLPVVDRIDRMEVFFPDAKTVTLPDASGSAPRVLNWFSKPVADYEVSASIADGQPMVTVTPPVEKNGTFYIDVPEGTFLCDGRPSQAFKQKFNVNIATGVSGVGEDSAETFEVYTLTGIRISGALTADQLRALPGGIYIVSGRKVRIQ